MASNASTGLVDARTIVVVRRDSRLFRRPAMAGLVEPTLEYRATVAQSRTARSRTARSPTARSILASAGARRAVPRDRPGATNSRRARARAINVVHLIMFGARSPRVASAQAIVAVPRDTSS